MNILIYSKYPEGGTMKKIGIVGLGIMGRGMAENFLKNGYEVYVWNRTRTVAENFVSKGAIVCNTPSEVAQKANIIFEVTANDESSREMWEGSDGILAGADKTKFLIASATLSVKWTDELFTKCDKKGFRFLDIPLTGGRIGAETGNLILLCGGSENNLKQIKSALEAISSKIFHFGPEGHGMRYKLILNFIQAVHMIGFGQAMKIAKANNMDLQKVSQGLTDRPGGIITTIGKNTYFKEPDPVTFSIEWLTKDLTYAKRLADKLDVSLLDDVLKEYKKAMEKGYGNKDWASVNTLI